MTKEEHVQTYVVQLDVEGRWETQATFFVDERKQAIRAAKDMFKHDTHLNVRVIYDSYNHQSNYHTNAVVYKSKPTKKLDADYIARFIKERKIKPLTLGEYMGALICVGLFGAAVGVIILLAAGFLLDYFQLNMVAKTKQFMMYGLSGLAAFFALYLGGQYVRDNYRYDRHKRMSLLKQETEEKAKKAKRDYVSPTSGIVQYEMKIAASDMSDMTVNDHKRTDISPYEEMDHPEELLAEHAKIAAQERQQQEAIREKHARHKKLTAFLSVFLDDCLYALHKKSIALQGEPRFGVMLFMMGACDYYVERLSLDEAAEENLKTHVLMKLGLKGDGIDEFLLDLERYYQNPRYHGVINKGAQIAVLAKTARKEAAERIVPVLKIWLKEAKLQEADDNRPYILACQIIPTSVAGWPAQWGGFLGQFTSYMFDYDEDHQAVLMNFRTIRGVYEASNLIREALSDWQETGDEQRVTLRFGLCHVSEDEVYGDHALALLDHVQGEGLYFTSAVYDSMEERESYAISHLAELKIQNVTGSIYRFDQDKHDEEAEISPQVKETERLELQDFG